MRGVHRQQLHLHQPGARPQLHRDECEILAHDKCESDHSLAWQHPLLAQQIVLPDCEQLPPIGTRDSEDCVELGIPLVRARTTAAPRPPLCWTTPVCPGPACTRPEIQTVRHLELIGGHNYCRNPAAEAGELRDTAPWCYTDHDTVTREVCAVFNMWLNIAVPAVSALAFLCLSIGLCCIRREQLPG